MFIGAGGVRLPTFDLAHRARQSRAIYHPDLSVYNVARLGIRDFDVVFFLGVYYHLKDPLLALARLRQVTRDGATLVVEGPAYSAPGPAMATYHYRRPFADDTSNWWIPNLACLREWIQSSYFEVRSQHPVDDRRAWYRRRRPVSRFALTATAVRRADALYPPFPVVELGAYDTRPPQPY